MDKHFKRFCILSASVLAALLLFTLVYAFTEAFLRGKASANRAVKNDDPEHIRPLSAKAPTRWRVCIFNGNSPKHWHFEDEFWQACAKKIFPGIVPTLANGESMRAVASRRNSFTHYINSSSSDGAAQRLRELAAQAAAAGAMIDLVAILDHGRQGLPMFGDRPLRRCVLEACQEALGSGDASGVVFLGCDVAGGPNGKHFLETAARHYRLTFTASALPVASCTTGHVTEFKEVWRCGRDGGAAVQISQTEAEELLEPPL